MSPFSITPFKKRKQKVGSVLEPMKNLNLNVKPVSGNGERPKK